MVPKSTKIEASNRYTFLLCFFKVSRGAQKSEHVFGRTCALQITSGTNHMAHVIGGKIVRKGTQIHQESMTRTSPRKDMKKVVHVLKMCQKVSNMVSKRVTLHLHLAPWRHLWQLWRSTQVLDAKSVAKEVPKW